jgi:S-DNA-T family DNA segregation ATPase FtsK/SpoIIIE
MRQSDQAASRAAQPTEEMTHEDATVLTTSRRIRYVLLDALAFASILAASSGIEAMRMWSYASSLSMPGGVVGETLARECTHALSFTGATLALLLLLAIGISLFFRFSWLQLAEYIGELIVSVWLRIELSFEAWRDRRAGKVAALRREDTLEQSRALVETHEPIHIEPNLSQAPTLEYAIPETQPIKKPATSSRVSNKTRQTAAYDGDNATDALPTIALLDPTPLSQRTVSAQTLEFTSRLIEKKLKDFGVEVNVVGAYPGPVITRYEIELATGIKGNQIVNLAKDLARSLSLVSIRVVETIPGKNYMGLELPNAERQTVRLAEILGSEVYAKATSILTIGLGKDISGHPIVADLAKMPHLLVAGTTGSGKSVGVNAMILSLLYKATPDQVRMILIDPKMLEMSVYEDIGHLLCPVVTDMRQAGNALNWIVAEMERRYRLMSKLGVRNLGGYNQKIDEAAQEGTSISDPFSLTPEAPEPLERLPHIVVVIDELADLMMVVGKKIEELIARIAQKARAAGIHLILATQRPSVDVITGLIKANIPTRIAFQVSSKIDSRTILDQQGAESLLGMGDMLYLPPGTGLPIRVHGAFVSDEEVHRVVKKLKEQGEPAYIEGILEGGVTGEGEEGSAGMVGLGGIGGEDGESDPLYDRAVELVVKHRRASISLVQRHLRIGYNRAARLLEQMENAGLVSAMSSNGNREILVPQREAE